MRTIYEIRLANARKLASKYKNQAEFANAINKPATQVSRFMGKNPTKNIGDEIASDIEVALGLESGYLDIRHYDFSLDDINSAIAVSSPRTSAILSQVNHLVDEGIELSDQEESIIKSILDSVKKRHKE